MAVDAFYQQRVPFTLSPHSEYPDGGLYNADKKAKFLRKRHDEDEGISRTSRNGIVYSTGRQVDLLFTIDWVAHAFDVFRL